MMRNAASRGEPNSVLIAAKLPAEAMIVTAIGCDVLLHLPDREGREARRRSR